MKELIEFAKRNIGDILMAILLIVVFIGLIVATKCEQVADDETTICETSSETVHICPPTVEVVTPPAQETYYTEPSKTGIVDIYTVGMSLVMDDFIQSDMTLCTWGNMVFTQEEIELLRTTVFCEAGNQDLETQVMVTLTVLNRYKAGYSDSIRGVIYQDGAYAVTKWSNFESRGWTEQVAKAVDIALSKNNHPSDMYYFRTKYYHDFATNYMKSGDLYFSTQKGD